MSAAVSPSGGAPPLRVLLVSAAAPELGRIDLEEELRALHRLEAGLRGSSATRRALTFVGGHAARLSDVRELCAEHAPDVVHFAAHGSARGRLLLRDDEGRAAPVDGEALGDALSGGGDAKLLGVVMVACHSATLFPPLAKRARWLVGMTDELRDDYAIQFARQLYLQLGAGAEIDDAFALACADAHSRFSGGRGVPQLFRGAQLVAPALPRVGGHARIHLHWAPARERTFVGRELALGALDAAWREPDTRVCVVTSEPGGGKSALVHTWLERMRLASYGDATRVYSYSFRGQGAGAPASPSEFFWDDLASALGLGAAVSRWQRMDAAVAKLRDERALLVLDGVDAHLDRHGCFEVDSLLRPFLDAMAAPGHEGLLVATATPPFEEVLGPGASLLSLDPLPLADAERLMRAHGVKGERRRGALLDALDALGGHPLLLSAFARHVVEAHDGRVPASTRWLGGGGPHETQVQALVRELDRRYGAASPERAVLRTLALFDRPVSVTQVEPLWARGEAQGIVGLRSRVSGGDNQAESGAAVTPRDLWRRAAERLVRARLVTRSRRHGRTCYELHPLVRTTYVAPAREQRAAHVQLYRAARAKVKALAPPERRADLDALHDVVRHGCLAGRHAEAHARFFAPLVEGQDFSGVRRFGISPAHLALLRSFFASPWSAPHASFDDVGARALLQSAAYALRAAARLDDARDAAEAMLARARASNPPAARDVAVALGMLATIQLAGGRFPAALSLSEEAVRAADASGEPRQRWEKRAIRAWALHLAGEPVAAARELDAADEFGAMALPARWGVLGYQRVQLALALGRVDEAKGVTARGLAEHRARGDLQSSGLARLAHLRVVLATREGLRGARPLREAHMAGRELQRFGDLQLWLESQLVTAQVLLRDGRADDARALLAEPVELARRQGLVPLRARLERVRDEG